MAEQDSEGERLVESPAGSDERAGNADDEVEAADDDESSLIPPEILEAIPPNERRTVTRAFASLTQIAAPVFNPIFRRITSDHLTSIIEYTESASVRADAATSSERRYQFGVFSSRWRCHSIPVDLLRCARAI